MVIIIYNSRESDLANIRSPPYSNMAFYNITDDLELDLLIRFAGDQK